jgi:hypothetical protein
MRELKTLSALMAVALAVAVLATASASADIVNSSGVYGSEQIPATFGATAIDPVTFRAGGVEITCFPAGISGEMDGDWDEAGPADASLDFAWDGCTAAAGAQSCTVDPVHDVPVNFTESTLLAPDWQMVNTDRLQSFIDCTGGVFDCDWWSDPADGTALVADVDSETQVISFDGDTVGFGGTFGCPSPGQYDARYQIVSPEDALSSTGSQ